MTFTDTLFLKGCKLSLLIQAGALFYISTLGYVSSFPEISIIPALIGLKRGVLGLGLLPSLFDSDDENIKNEKEMTAFLKHKIYKYSSPVILRNDPDSYFFNWLKENRFVKQDLVFWITPILTALSGYGIYDYGYAYVGLLVEYLAFVMVMNRFSSWQRNQEWKDHFVSKIQLEDDGKIKVFAMNSNEPLICDIGKTRFEESDSKNFNEKSIEQGVLRVEFFEIETKKYHKMNIYLENTASRVENISLLDDILRGDADEIAKYKLVDEDDLQRKKMDASSL